MSTGNNSIKEYLVGQMPQLTFTFTNAANVLTNPTTIVVQITDPTGTQVNTTSPNAAITVPSTGVWVYTAPAALSIVGTYIWRVKATGTLTDSDEGTFTVLATLTPTP